MFQLGTQNEGNCVTVIISKFRSPKCFLRALHTYIHTYIHTYLLTHSMEQSSS